MLLSNKKKHVDLANYLSTQSKDDPFHYLHKNIGFNYRLTNIQAALGQAQMENLEYFLSQKKVIYDYYLEKLKDIPEVELVTSSKKCVSNHWMNVIRLVGVKTKLYRDRIIKELLENKIECRPVWFPNHLQAPFKSFQSYRVRKTRSEVESCICLPSSTSLTEKDVSRVVKVIKKNSLILKKL